MKSAWLAAVMIAAVVFAYGCTNTSSTTQNTNSPFIGGNEGLAISFVQGNPPSEVFDNQQQPFDIVVQLKNVGEYDVAATDTQLKLSGLSPSDFNVAGGQLVKSATEDLPKTQKDPTGKSVLDGGMTTVSFNNLEYIPTVSGPTTFPIRVDVCYMYGTIAESQLCIKQNPLDTRNNAVCQVDEAKQVDNSGAPVKVTGLTEFAKSANTIGFTFTITQVGNGNLYKRRTKCNDNSISLADENKVWVNVDTRLPNLICTGLIGDNNQQVANGGYTTLFGGTQGSGGLSRTITCTQPLPPRTTTYLQDVRITLEYDYKEFISSQIVVKHG